MFDFSKKLIYLFWIIAIVSLGIMYLIDPSFISVKLVVEFTKKFEGEMIFIFILISLIRGFFLIPSTPFVIAGGILFPDKLFTVLVISMVGVMFSSTLLYYFSDIIGFSKYLEKKHPEAILKWKTKLNTSNSIYLIIAWAFFPFVPTDLICYVSGIMKIPFKNVFAGVFIGELFIITIYIYFGSSIF